MPSRKRGEICGDLFLPRSFRAIGFPANRHGSRSAPGTQGSMPLMNPNVHAIKMENNRFRDAVCCSVIDLYKETAIATSAWADMRDMHAARTTGTWE